MPRFNFGKSEPSANLPTVEQVLVSGTISGAGRDKQTLSRCHEQIDSYFAPPIIEGTRVLEELNHDESQGCAFLKVDHGPIDHFLGGGLQRGRLTEIYGESGSGKTQFCLSACATAASLGNRVVYIDTSNAFSAQRIVQILEQRVDQATGHDQPLFQSMETALDHISVVNAYSIHKVLHALDSLLQKDPNTPNTSQPPSLVILDSLGAVITPVLGGARNLQGHAVLSTCAMLLKQVAAQLKSVVIVSNHVVRGFAPYQDNAQHRFREKSQPALGFSWQHQAHLRLELSMASANDSGGGGSDFGGSGYILSKITKNRRLSMKYSTYLPVSGRYIDVEVSEAGLTASSTF